VEDDGVIARFGRIYSTGDARVCQRVKATRPEHATEALA